MKRFCYLLFALVVSIATIAVTPAIGLASITPGDFVGGVVNHLEDDDFEGGILNGDLTLDVGDVLFGNFRVQALRVPPFGATVPGTNNLTTTITGVFAIEVATKVAAGADFDFTFAPVDDATWLSIFLPTYGVRVDSNTMVAAFQDIDAPDYIDNTGANTGSNGTFLYEFGFLAGFDSVEEGFWHSTGNGAPLLNTVSNPGDLTLGLFTLAQAVGTPELSPHDFLDFTTALGTAVSYDLEAFGNYFNDPASPDSSVLPLASDNDFFILPVVPEPSTLAIWSLLAIIVAAGGYSRRVGR